MQISQKTTAALFGAALLLSSSAVNAANITISDNNSGSSGSIETSSGWYKGGSAYLGTSGATQALSEYQEVEPGMQTGSVWDLAAFVNPSSGRLGVVSAYNLAAGYGGTTLGDIMVSVNPANVSGYADPNTAYNRYVLNSAFHYDFAIRLNFSAGTYSVIDIDENTVMENGEYNAQRFGGYYNSASQPWRVANVTTTTTGQSGNTGNVIFSGQLTYFSNQSAATSSALTGYTVTSDYKYYAEIGTNWINPYLNNSNPEALYKLTMECGNDNMLGYQTAGFVRVPDGATTISLLGFSFLAIVGVSKYRGRNRR
jgi:hypothetical protein